MEIMRSFTIILLIGLAIIFCLDQASGVVLRESKGFDFNGDDYNDEDDWNRWSDKDERHEYDEHDNHHSNGPMKITRKYSARQGKGLGSRKSLTTNFGQSRRVSGADSQRQEGSPYTNGRYRDRSGDRYSEGGQFGNADDDKFDQRERSMRYSRGRNSRNRVRNGISGSRRLYDTRDYRSGRYGNSGDERFDQYDTRGYGRYGDSGGRQLDQYDKDDNYGEQMDQYGRGGYRDYYGGHGYGEYNGEQYGESGHYGDSSRISGIYGSRYDSRYGNGDHDASSGGYRASGMRQIQYAVDRDGCRYDSTWETCRPTGVAWGATGAGQRVHPHLRKIEAQCKNPYCM